jgi:hypothetical protein
MFVRNSMSLIAVHGATPGAGVATCWPQKHTLRTNDAPSGV